MSRDELVAEVERLREELRALRQSEQRYRSLVENAPVGIFTTDSRGRPLSVNVALARIVGLGTPQEAVDHYSDLGTQLYVDPARRREFVQRLMAEGAVKGFEYEARAADGGRLWLTMDARVESRGEDGSFTIEGFTTDITDRKRAEEALCRSEERWQFALEGAEDGVWDWNPRTNHVFFSRRWKSMLGYAEDEIGDTLDEWDSRVHPDDKAAAYADLDRHFRGETPVYRNEHRIRCKDGSYRWILDRGKVMEWTPDGKPLRVIGIHTDITERKHAEEALTKANAFLKEVIDQAPFAIQVAEGAPDDWILTIANRESQRIQGITASQHHGIHVLRGELVNPDRVTWQMFHPDGSHWPPTEVPLPRAIMKGETCTNVEMTVRRADGHDTPILCNAGPIRDGRGAIIGGVVTYQDVTELRRAQQTLRQSEERYRSLFELSPAAIILVDSEIRVVSVNARITEWLGHDTAQIVGHKTLELPFLAEESRRLIARNFLRRRAGEEILPYEIRMTTSRGDTVVAELTGAVIDVGERLSLIMLRDVTEKKRAEQALRESEERYRTLVESASFGIALFDPEMRILSANSRMREWYPDLSGQVGEPCYRWWPEASEGRPCPDCPVTLTVADGKSHERVKSCVTRQGPRDLRLLATPILREEGTVGGVIYTAEDVTDRLKLEREIVRSQKLESLGVLAGGIAHDFNNILVAILGNVSLARMDVPPGSDLDALLEEAEAASERAKDLTRQLLTFAKGGAPVKTTASIEEIIRESAGFCLRGSAVRCEFAFDADLRAVEVDPGQYSQVINNLIINASQAMPAGGTIRVTAANRTVPIGEASQFAPGDYVVVEVQDEGVGIPRENLQRVFDPFFTTKARGSGLGLASAYSIVKRHGGLIEVESEPGAGTRFRVYVPASDEGLAPGSRPGPQIPGGAGRILVVDDERTVRTLARMSLSRLGYEVEVAAEGAEAIAMFQKAREQGRPFDALVVDLTIPGGMGGREIVARLRVVDPRVKVIVSSGYSTDPIMADHERFGFVGCVAKPYRVRELAQVLRRVLVEEPPG